jgi:hypothetical protein
VATLIGEAQGAAPTASSPVWYGTGPSSVPPVARLAQAPCGGTAADADTAVAAPRPASSVAAVAAVAARSRIDRSKALIGRGSAIAVGAIY